MACLLPPRPADSGLVTYSDMVVRAGTIARGICKPLIADADTGSAVDQCTAYSARHEAAGVQEY